MTLLVCPTSFKGTLSATEVASAMARGARAVAPEADVRLLPLSDGGNGLLDALEALNGGRANATRVAGPLGVSVSARYLLQDGRVVVETAEACGLHLVAPPLRDPLRTSTRGVGELLQAARSAAEPGDVLVVGLGGSATVDAGSGMARALGWALLDDDDRPIPEGGGGLERLARVRAPEAPPDLGDLVVLCDVTNPLTGPNGAARVFGPQKGARARDVDALERGLERWAAVVARDVPGASDVATLAGGGAAGGLGAAFAALLGAPPTRGADWVLEAAGFDGLLSGASLVLTGEGAWDEQSSMGKLTGEVVRRSKAAGVPVGVVAGSVSGEPASGVAVSAGDGRELDADSVRSMTERLVAGLLPGGRIP